MSKIEFFINFPQLLYQDLKIGREIFKAAFVVPSINEVYASGECLMKNKVANVAKFNVLTAIAYAKNGEKLPFIRAVLGSGAESKKAIEKFKTECDENKILMPFFVSDAHPSSNPIEGIENLENLGSWHHLLGMLAVLIKDSKIFNCDNIEIKSKKVKKRLDESL